MGRLVLAAAAISCTLLSAASTEAQSKVAVGTLTCSSSGGIGYIVWSKKSYRCSFQPTGGKPAEFYRGAITNYGLDVGFTGKTVIAWAVVAAGDPWRPGLLAGNYVGVAVDGSIGIGGGGKALVGGWRDSVTLQPLSAQGQVGVNLAIGVSGLKLR